MADRVVLEVDVRERDGCHGWAVKGRGHYALDVTVGTAHAALQFVQAANAELVRMGHDAVTVTHWHPATVIGRAIVDAIGNSRGGEI